jgi:hypothetical protein
MAVYQSLKADTMVIDHIDIARDTAMSRGGASHRCKALRKKLIDTSNALTSEEQSSPEAVVTPDPIVNSERKMHKANVNVPMDLLDKVKVPQDPARVILLTLTAIGHFELDWNMLAEQVGVSDWQLFVQFTF